VKDVGEHIKHKNRAPYSHKTAFCQQELYFHEKYQKAILFFKGLKMIKSVQNLEEIRINLAFFQTHKVEIFFAENKHHKILLK
jgi:hypothetical protein